MQNKYLIPLVIIISLLVGGLLTYYYFPRDVEVIKYKTQYVSSGCVCEPCPTQITPDCNTKPRKEKDIAYVIEDGKLKQAGSSYSNTPNECALNHVRC